MKLSEALRAAEDLLEQVSTAGTDNWNRMSDGVKIVRAVRMNLEQQEREEMEHGSGDDPAGQRETEGAADTV